MIIPEFLNVDHSSTFGYDVIYPVIPTFDIRVDNNLIHRIGDGIKYMDKR